MPATDHESGCFSLQVSQRHAMICYSHSGVTCGLEQPSTLLQTPVATTCIYMLQLVMNELHFDVQELSPASVCTTFNCVGSSSSAAVVLPVLPLALPGGIRADRPEYSQGVRQHLWRMFGDGSNPQVLIHQGAMSHEEYARMLVTSKFCLAPSGDGWGIRLAHYIARGCVPVIVQVREGQVCVAGCSMPICCAIGERKAVCVCTW